MKTPRPYQQTAIDFGIARNMLLADACGLGKTYVASVIAQRLRSDVGRVLVVCPLRVREQWVEEIHEQDPEAEVNIIDTGLPVWLYPNGNYYVTHFEAVRDQIASYADEWWKIMIVDEAHRISNRNNQWTKAIKRIHAMRRIALTGTPMEKSPADLWSILNWIRPEAYRSYWKFYNKHVDWEKVYTRNGWFRKVRGTLDPGKLAGELRNLVLQRTKEEVEPDLPPRIIVPINLHMSEAQQLLYERMRTSDDIIVDYPDQGAELFVGSELTKILRLLQISSHPQILFDTDALSPKIEWAIEWCADHPNEQVVILASFRPTAEYVHSRLNSSELYMGGSRGLPKKFLSGRVQSLVGTIDAVGEGLNLQAADYAIFIDQLWSSRKMNQAFDRIHRMDIDRAKVLYILNHVDTFDSEVVKAYTEKWDRQTLVYHALQHIRNGPN